MNKDKLKRLMELSLESKTESGFQLIENLITKGFVELNNGSNYYYVKCFNDDIIVVYKGIGNVMAEHDGFYVKHNFGKGR